MCDKVRHCAVTDLVTATPTDDLFRSFFLFSTYTQYAVATAHHGSSPIVVTHLDRSCFCCS
jgi:hypothetical protein